MAKEEKMFSVQCELGDRDFEEVYRIYLEYEHKNSYISLLVCIGIAVLFVVLTFALKNMTFLFYAVAAVLVGIGYRFVPVNRKFLATNRLQYGEKREMTFYPHSISSLEILEDDEELSEEEREEASISFSTGSMKAFESKLGFIFADISIQNNFLYVPKRDQEDETVAMLIDYAKNRCSGGYELVETKSMILDEETVQELTGESADKVEAAADDCERYYGADKLRIFDSEGNRIKDFDAEEETEKIAEDAELSENTVIAEDTAADTEESEHESE